MNNIIETLWWSFILFLMWLSFILWWLIWKLIYDFYLEKKWKDLQSKIDKTQEKIEIMLERSREKMELEASQIIDKAHEKSAEILENINNQKDKIYDKEKQLDKILKEQDDKLFKISQLSKEEAKKEVFKNIENEYNNDLASYVEKVKEDTVENAKQQANDIIAKTIYRVSVENSNNFLVQVVDLPSEDYKWRIIGREWRNIQFFEKITWVNLSMDDTPKIIKLSSFNPEKRFIAKITLERLIKDGRINPVYIEKFYNETSAELVDILKNIWKETLLELWIPMMNPTILEYIGRFELRYSYWQNLLSHSKEVAKISELLANELWYDGLLAKKAWLLHDIWKIDVNSWESHAKVWADILRQNNMNEIIVNAAESHHFEVKQIHPISWIVTAADAISAWREWVRHNNTEKYIERIKSLENLVLNIDWVKKTYIMQAWREIWAFIDENIISDFEVKKLNKDIKNKIEQNLDYPWIIKIVSIRENKVIDYVG